MRDEFDLFVMMHIMTLVVFLLYIFDPVSILLFCGAFDRDLRKWNLINGNAFVNACRIRRVK